MASNGARSGGAGGSFGVPVDAGTGLKRNERLVGDLGRCIEERRHGVLAQLLGKALLGRRVQVRRHRLAALVRLSAAGVNAVAIGVFLVRKAKADEVRRTMRQHSPHRARLNDRVGHWKGEE